MESIHLCAGSTQQVLHRNVWSREWTGSYWALKGGTCTKHLSFAKAVKQKMAACGVNASN